MTLYKPPTGHGLLKTTIERRESIAERILKFGVGINQSLLAQEFGVHRTTINNDVKRVILAWPKPDMEATGMDLVNATSEALRVSRQEMLHKDPSIRLRAASAVGSIAKSKTAILEAYSYKDKAESKLVVGVSDDSRTERIVRELLGGKDGDA